MVFTASFKLFGGGTDRLTYFHKRFVEGSSTLKNWISNFFSILGNLEHFSFFHFGQTKIPPPLGRGVGGGESSISWSLADLGYYVFTFFRKEFKNMQNIIKSPPEQNIFCIIFWLLPTVPRMLTQPPGPLSQWVFFHIFLILQYLEKLLSSLSVVTFYTVCWAWDFSIQH